MKRIIHEIFYNPEAFEGKFYTNLDKSIPILKIPRACYFTISVEPHYEIEKINVVFQMFRCFIGIECFFFNWLGIFATWLNIDWVCRGNLLGEFK